MAKRGGGKNTPSSGGEENSSEKRVFTPNESDLLYWIGPNKLTADVLHAINIALEHNIEKDTETENKCTIRLMTALVQHSINHVFSGPDSSSQEDKRKFYSAARELLLKLCENDDERTHAAIYSVANYAQSIARTEHDRRSTPTELPTDSTKSIPTKVRDESAQTNTTKFQKHSEDKLSELERTLGLAVHFADNHKTARMAAFALIVASEAMEFDSLHDLAASLRQTCIDTIKANPDEAFEFISAAIDKNPETIDCRAAFELADVCKENQINLPEELAKQVREKRPEYEAA